jgi:hypothetical protein
LDLEEANAELANATSKSDSEYIKTLDSIINQIESQQKSVQEADTDESYNSEADKLAQLLIKYQLLESGAISADNFDNVQISVSGNYATVTFTDKDSGEVRNAYFDYKAVNEAEDGSYTDAEGRGDRIVVVEKNLEYSNEAGNYKFSYSIDFATGDVTYKVNGEKIDSSRVTGNDKDGYQVSDLVTGTSDSYEYIDSFGKTKLIKVNEKGQIEIYDKQYPDKYESLLYNYTTSDGAHITFTMEDGEDGSFKIVKRTTYDYSTTFVEKISTYEKKEVKAETKGVVEFKSSAFSNDTDSDFVDEKQFNDSKYKDEVNAAKQATEQAKNKVSTAQDKKNQADEAMSKAQEKLNNATDAYKAAVEALSSQNNLIDALKESITALTTTKEEADKAQKAAAEAFENVKAAVAAIGDIKAEAQVNLKALKEAEAKRDAAVSIYNKALEDKAESENNVKRAEEAAKKAADLAGLDFQVVVSIVETDNVGDGGNGVGNNDNNGNTDNIDNTVSTANIDNTDNTVSTANINNDNENTDTATVTASTPTQTIVDDQTPLAATPDFITIADDDVALAADLTYATNAASANASSSAKSVASSNAESSSSRYTKVIDASESLTMIIEDEDTALAAQVPTITSTDDNATLTIADEDAPLAAVPIGEKKISWWWLLIIALLGATGYEMYKKHREKQLAEENANNQ